MQNLITDIIEELKTNPATREKFSEDSEIFDVSCLTPDGDIEFCLSNQTGEVELYYYSFEGMDNFAKQLFLLTALSSPNGKPLMSFLNELVHRDIIQGYKIYMMGDPIMSEILFQTFTDELYKGKSFDEAYKVTNDKYNELCSK